MKSTFLSISCLLACLGGAAQSQAQPRYAVITLSTLGGTGGAANSINNRGWVMGAALLPGNATEHAAVWLNGQIHDLGTLGGANSSVAWSSMKNDLGSIAGVSDTAIVDPLGETWSCALAFFPSVTGHTCQGFRATNHVMSALPTLGGSNGVAAGANNRDEIAGWAETANPDATCVPPQVLQFEAVVYGPGAEQIRELPPLSGDVDGAATAINDRGQVVGISGTCGTAVGGATAAHAVLWENGAAMDIGNLGGVAWNTPTAINNNGVVVGFSDLPGDSPDSPNYHAFIWTKSAGIHDLGVLAGDAYSIAWGINEAGVVVGQSINATGASRAFVWQNGVMTDLNSLVAPGSVSLVYANDINDAGVIVGGAYDAGSGTSPAFQALPLTH